ncbi:butirosin biosynthesis, BtrG-like protein [Artemisia annua]|uniref:Gamma-glutamylcyclotransferase family protein n=1 Tax=Artemisia annua TaxID=35608 RepID=A0A2U1KC93_ARTAN|nr:butirosin biosynthesis, BtrG-like protein [Artemisia annua]
MTISSTTTISQKQNQTLIFSYGTLKKGFANHKLMQTLISQKDAVFIGNYTTDLKLPLVQGPHGVPFLLNLPCTTSSHRVSGELYSVTDVGLQRLDVLEGVTLGHYERLPIGLRQVGGVGKVVVMAEAYFGHRSFAQEMWRRNGEKGFESFDREVEKGYVRRDLRPKDRSFREMIEIFCAEGL